MLFNLGWLHSEKFEVPTIVIGNISTGGTGKTPTTEFLLARMQDYKLGFVSRGYGRRTKGLRLISATDNPLDIGDEPWQIMNKFPGLQGAVAEKRVLGIQALLEEDPPEVIILDDAFQHRYVDADLNILLTTWAEPFFLDQLLPAGNLRENRKAKNRAEIIIVTKCPSEISQAQRAYFIKRLKPDGQVIFFSALDYGPLKNEDGELLPDHCSKVNLLTGIANPKPLVQKLHSQFELNEHWEYADHHRFTSSEIQQLEASELPIITTEKDWARLKLLVSSDLSKRIYPWPIQMKILFDQEQELMDQIKKVMI